MPFVPDETDLRIVRLLQEDGRMSNVDLARTLVMAEGTVRNTCAVVVLWMPGMPANGPVRKCSNCSSDANAASRMRSYLPVA